MYCRKCGTQNDDKAFRCFQCGGILQHGVRGGKPQQTIPNYLAQSILVTLLCCLPLGIPAIIFATQVNGKIQAGDIQGAMESSRLAKMWCWLSFGFGLAISIGWIFFYAAYAFLLVACAMV